SIVLVQIGAFQPAATSSAASCGIRNAVLEAAIRENWDDVRAKAVVKKARAIVDGRTGQEIIQIAEYLKRDALEATIAIYEQQLEKAKAALKDLDAEAEAAKKERENAAQ